MSEKFEQLEFPETWEHKDRVKMFRGDSLSVLAGLPDNSVDSLVCDPPAGISFMGKAFDSDRGGRDLWIKWLTSIMRECMRVLKPGAHGLVWALPRTSHWTGTAVEDAGFEVRDVVSHCFGNGLPKNHDIGKAIDREAGATREVIGTYDTRGMHEPIKAGRTSSGSSKEGILKLFDTSVVQKTKPATAEAEKWDGWGTALKPSMEMWYLVRKPLDKGMSIARNVLAHDTGGLNIDGSRVGNGHDRSSGGNSGSTAIWSDGDRPTVKRPTGGRWPGNFMMSHSPECVMVGEKEVKNKNDRPNSAGKASKQPPSAISFGCENKQKSLTMHSDADGMETVEDWQCVESCPVHLMGQQSGVSSARPSKAARAGKIDGNEQIGNMFGVGNSKVRTFIDDSGTASRYFRQFEASTVSDYDPFFYCSKPSPSERKKGLEEKNSHPTVKSIKLMTYLINLITPPNGLVLDCFMGSGSMGVAAVQAGYHFIGIELEEEYFLLAKERVLDGVSERKKKAVSMLDGPTILG